MQRYSDWRDLPTAARGATVALGNFDGVHRGHALLLASAHAARPDAPLAALTFEPHPRELFRPDDPPFRLSLPSARAEALGALGVQHVIEVKFDRTFSLLTADEFITQVLHQGLGALHLASGPDFAFGHRRGGDVSLLSARAEALGMGLTIVPPLADTRGPISSTRIRRALQDGYPERATDDLGHPWSIRGIVSHGDALGRTIGFPTANIPLGPQLEPARGVYAVTVPIDGRLVYGVANIGRRPTVAEGAISRVEVHLFDYAGDLYGQQLDVAVLHFLRAERRFAGLPELKAQIALDAAEARRLLGN
ncbi:riboflavin biosynthesis protein RibF [Acidisphaera sp. L21]|uniref:riboflavin biosynthesis protein RibF n=1 Tax=Acidisphaera sp. L21 TaxID=1641851 RepID=UPI00131E061E|nr:riboflavin biosynthesis protein RibF [Acidisphaera sp. L21]